MRVKKKMAMIDNIQNWIIKQIEKDNIKEYETAFGNSFGFVDMPDGRKAQVQIILEMDTDNWE